MPFGAKLTGPLGCTSPYESCTAKAAVLELTPAKLSAIVPDIVTVAIFPFGGQRIAGLAEAIITGAVLSMLIPLTVDVAELPATSMQVPLTDCPAPSAERTVGAGGLLGAKPERVSAHAKLIVTLVLFQPLAFAAGERAPVIIGDVLSSLMVTVFAVSMLPALSVPK